MNKRIFMIGGLIVVLVLGVLFAGCTEVKKEKQRFEVTVVSHGWYNYTQAGQYGVTVTLKNLQDGQEDVYTTFFKLFATDGTAYTWAGETEDIGSLAAGASGTITVFFNMPDDKTAAKIMYDDPIEDIYDCEAPVQNMQNEVKPNVWQLTIGTHGWIDDSEHTYDGYFYVNITLKNINSVDETVYEWTFKLYDDDDDGYTVEDYDGTAPDSLAPNSSMTLTLYFDMDDDETPEKLVYDKDDIRTETTAMF